MAVRALFLGSALLYQLLDQRVGERLLQDDAFVIGQGVRQGLGPLVLDEDNEGRTAGLKMLL